MLDAIDEQIKEGLYPQRALSLTGPWWWFMLHLPPEWLKRVENRTPGFSWKSFRGPVWVHAAKGATLKGYLAARQFALDGGVPADVVAQCPSFDMMHRGGIVGRFTVADCFGPPGIDNRPEATEPSVRRWRMLGQFGFVVTDARPVPFTPCAGAQGFWRVPHDVLRKLAGAK